jgi:hypothetical protein
MYRYVMKKSLKDRLRYYHRGGPVTWDSFTALANLGFPQPSIYCWVLRKLAQFEFYSPKLLHEVFVQGYPVHNKFFDITELKAPEATAAFKKL